MNAAVPGFLVAREIPSIHRVLQAAAIAAAALLGACASPYDLVVSGGRIIDPASGTDRIADLAIAYGEIVKISEEPLRGREVIVANGMVVAPGFIDLHRHVMNRSAMELAVRDGVTTAFDLEIGAADVDQWYASRAGGQLINYGVSAGHIPARMQVMEDEGTTVPDGPAASDPAKPEQVRRIIEIVGLGLDRGALGVGLGTGYTPGMTGEELSGVLSLARERGATVFVHSIKRCPAVMRFLDKAQAVDASVHLMHVNSTLEETLPDCLPQIAERAGSGLDVSWEAYPYGAGMTYAGSAVFEDWEDWPDERFGNVQILGSEGRLDRAGFAQAREENRIIIVHTRTAEETRMAITYPGTIVASDGTYVPGAGHPRSIGTFSKVLGQYVREEAALSLSDALARMTIMPARRLAAYAPQMAKRGRIETGAAADLVIFDPDTIGSMADFANASASPAGIAHVIVNGEIAVTENAVTASKGSGVAIRNALIAEGGDR